MADTSPPYLGRIDAPIEGAPSAHALRSAAPPHAASSHDGEPHRALGPRAAHAQPVGQATGMAVDRLAVRAQRRPHSRRQRSRALVAVRRHRQQRRTSPPTAMARSPRPAHGGRAPSPPDPMASPLNAPGAARMCEHRRATYGLYTRRVDTARSRRRLDRGAHAAKITRDFERADQLRAELRDLGARCDERNSESGLLRGRSVSARARSHGVAQGARSPRRPRSQQRPTGTQRWTRHRLHQYIAPRAPSLRRARRAAVTTSAQHDYTRDPTDFTSPTRHSIHALLAERLEAKEGRDGGRYAREVLSQRFGVEGMTCEKRPRALPPRHAAVASRRGPTSLPWHAPPAGRRPRRHRPRRRRLGLSRASPTMEAQPVDDARGGALLDDGRTARCSATSRAPTRSATLRSSTASRWMTTSAHGTSRARRATAPTARPPERAAPTAGADR